MWKSYGPEGSDDIVVMGIEGDASTSIAAIAGGSGGNTLGNWRDGVSYTMIDAAAVSSMLGVNGFPTVFRICPVDKKIYELPIQPSRQVIKSAIFNGSCTVPLHTSDPALIDVEVLKNVCPGGETEMSAVVFNSGTTPMSFAVVEVVIDDIVQSQTPNLADYQNGIYILKLVNDNVSLTNRVMLNK